MILDDSVKLWNMINDGNDAFERFLPMYTHMATAPNKAAYIMWLNYLLCLKRTHFLATL